MFADALPHVPDHRRLPVLVQLVETLGPARFLWVLMLLLFKLHATHTSIAASEKVTYRPSNSEQRDGLSCVNARVLVCPGSCSREGCRLLDLALLSV